MKKLLFSISLFCAGVFSLQAQTTIKPDCSIPFNFTTTASTSNLTCGNNTLGVTNWVLVYFSTGFSGISLVVQSAPDNHGVPGTFVTYAGTVLSSTQYPGSSGINPNTATTSANTGFAGYYPWVRVTLSSITGTGKVTGILYGFLNSTLSKAAGNSSGGGGPTIAGTAGQISVTGAGCITGSQATCTISIPNNPTLPGVVTGGGFVSAEAASGNFQMNGFTSGNVTLTVADVAGTAIAYMWPSTNGTAGQVLSDSGVATCPTLPAGAPTVCHQLAWIAAGGGGGSAGGGVLGYSASALTLPTAGTTFLAPIGGALASTTEANVTANAPAAAAISNMYVSLSAAPGTGNTVAFTFRDAGSSTALTCTISGATATTCNDTTHSFTPVVGDALAIQVVTTGTVIIAPAAKIIAEYGVTGGGGGGSTRGTFATRPSCSTAGASYFATDVPIISECNASTWADWAYGQNVTLPSAITFTTVLNSAAITTNGVATVVAPIPGGSAYGEDLAIPSTPYTLYIGFRCLMPFAGAYCGLYVRDTTGTNIVTWAEQALGPNSLNFQVAHFTNYTGFSGAVQDFALTAVNQGFGPQYLKLHDDGTNLTFFVCTDKFNCTVSLFSESRTANLSNPGFFGWFATGNVTSAISMVLFDWSVTQP